MAGRCSSGQALEKETSMSVERYCQACQMAFDWPGTIADGEEYCCEACAAGEPCTCPGHQHADEEEEE
jgi:hypothetical protein